MDIPETCNYCGRQYRGSACYSCETNAQYGKHFTKCFMCGATSELRLPYDPDAHDRVLSMALENSPSEGKSDSEEDQQPHLLIRIIDGLDEEFSKCGGTSYDDEVERMKCHGKRIEKARAFTKEDAEIARQEFSSNEISKHVAVLCSKCLKKKENILRQQLLDESDISNWVIEWRRFEFGESYPYR